MTRYLFLLALASVVGCGPSPQTPVATDAVPATASAEIAPDFSLTDINGKAHKLADYRGKFVVLEWINHGCPFVQKHYGAGNMQRLQNAAVDSGVVWLSIASSGPGKQGHHSPEEWKKLSAEKASAASAVLLDPDGIVGKMYDARTTPHMFVISPDGAIIYKGGIDDNPSADPAVIAGAKNFVSAALDEAMSGRPVTVSSHPPYGCGIKYL